MGPLSGVSRAVLDVDPIHTENRRVEFHDFSAHFDTFTRKFGHSIVNTGNGNSPFGQIKVGPFLRCFLASTALGAAGADADSVTRPEPK